MCITGFPPTIRIRVDAVVFLAQRIHPIPSAQHRVVLPCPIVVGVQSVHSDQFLAVVPARLHVAVRGAVAELRAEWIVVHRLYDRPVCGAAGLDDLAYVAEMVAVVVVEIDVVLAGVAGILHRLAVALLELELVDAPVPQREATPEEVVRGVRAQDLRGSKLPGAADGYGDVRDSRLVDDAQFLACGAVDVPSHAAIGELDADGVVLPVVVYPRYPAPGVFMIIHNFILSNLFYLKKYLPE